MASNNTDWNAIEALYRAKDDGRNRMQFDPAAQPFVDGIGQPTRRQASS